MTWRRPWWTYWTARVRAAKHLIAQMDGHPLYCLVQVDPETRHETILNTVEPTGLWTMTSISEDAMSRWIAQIRVANRSSGVSAVQSKDTRAATTIRLLRGVVGRASSIGAHVWVSPTRMLRVPLHTLIDAGSWFDAQEPETPATDPIVAAAVDQLIAETAPTGKETA